MIPTQEVGFLVEADTRQEVEALLDTVRFTSDHVAVPGYADLALSVEVAAPEPPPDETDGDLSDQVDAYVQRLEQVGLRWSFEEPEGDLPRVVDNISEVPGTVVPLGHKVHLDVSRIDLGP